MPKRKPLVLFIDDDKNFRQVTAYTLKNNGLEVVTATNGKEGLEALENARPDVILCDLKMPVMDGMEFLEAKRKRGDATPVIVATAFGSIENAVAAMRAGAVDYITKPLNRDELTLAIERTLERQKLRRENRALRERLAGGRTVDRLIGASTTMKDLRDTLLRLAESDAPVLLRGESGVGKELAARALHYDGPRSSSGQFVVLNCAAIPGELLESELFGHCKGAFTGAHHDHIGKFEAADGGTLFLDEIGDMPMNLQTKLLRALQEHEIMPVGENSPRKVDVRVLAATNQSLEDKIRKGAFRQDLYFRLAVIPLELPPLRTRLDDLAILLNHFLAKYGAPGAEISKEAMAIFKNYSWPGNVRELENVVMRASALFPGLRTLALEQIQLPNMEPEQLSMSSLGDDAPIQLPPEGIRLEQLEKKMLLAAWEQSDHNQTAGAKLLGLSRQAYIYRLQKHGILPPYGNPQQKDRP